MKNVINTVIWVVLFLLLLPSSIAVASWNSLPGMRLFGVKLAMEQALVAVSPSAEMKGSLQIHYTQRRFAEAQKLLANETSAKGLVYLDSQVRVTKQQIVAATDPVVKRDLAQKYIVALQTVSTQLEEQKQVAVANAPREIPTAVSQPTPTPFAPTPTAVIVLTQKITIAPKSPPSVVPTPTPPPTVPQISGVEPPVTESIVVSITTSQQEIHQTIEDMQKISDESEHESNGQKAKEENKGNTNENKAKGKD